MAQPTMDIIVNEGLDRSAYPGASNAEVVADLPEYNGGITLTIRVQQAEPAPLVTPLTIDQNLHGGVPCVGRGQWPITHILHSLAAGLHTDQLIQEYPGLTISDIQLALDVASWVMREPTIDWSALDLLGMVEFQREMHDWQSLSDNSINGVDNS